jgi:hypothetical protein
MVGSSSVTGDNQHAGEFSRDFQEGLIALQEAVEETDEPVDADVRVVATNDNKNVVRLGEYDLSKFELSEVDYAHDRTVVFVQIPQTFPTGANAKGLAAAPPLERDDHADLENNPKWSDGMANAIGSATDHDDVEDYSYNWNQLDFHHPEDMTQFLKVGREFLRQG